MNHRTREDCRILVVDDNAVNVELLEAILEDEGYTTVACTTDSRCALDLFAEFEPDLVLLDLMMPQVDGFELLAGIRAATADDEFLPVLVITGDPSAASKERALAAGATDFVAKPFGCVEVGLRIRNMLHTRLLHGALRESNVNLEQKVAERTGQLDESLRRYRSLVERLPAVVYVEDLDESGSRYVSPGVFDLLGLAPDRFIAEPDLWARRVHPDDLHSLLRAPASALASGGTVVCEYRMLRSDGTLVWVRDESTVVWDESGSRRYLQGIVQDVTERRRTHDAQRATFERQVASERELRSLDRMKNQFLTSISHEFRTPLASITGFAATLEKRGGELTADHVADIVKRIAKNAKRLGALLEDVLDVDRLARGALEPRREKADVGEVVRRAVETTGLARPVHVVGEATAAIDVAKVERIVEHLLVNAGRYTPEGSPVRIEVAPAGDGVQIMVDDEGAGVPNDMKRSIFQPLLHGAEVLEHSPGIGTGLALVARFAEIHGGRAWVEDRPGGGSSFRVLLPADGQDAGTLTSKGTLSAVGAQR